MMKAVGRSIAYAFIKNTYAVRRMKAAAKKHRTGIEWLLLEGRYKIKLSRSKRRWLLSHVSSPPKEQRQYIDIWKTTDDAFDGSKVNNRFLLDELFQWPS